MDDLNPARLSDSVAALFPPGSVAAELVGRASMEVLTPAELESISHCSQKRMDDFAAGRACARRALLELGIRGFSLLAREHRQPAWPDSVVGSITHTEGCSAAVVAREEHLSALGLDCEVADAVKESTWRGICAPEELSRLGRLPPDQGRCAGALVFAAKEAFYKCQFPLTGEWVGFEDVVIESDDWSASSGRFRVVAQRALRLHSRTGSAALTGRFCFRERWVMAGIAIAAGCENE